MEEYHSENMTINKKRMRATQACILCRKKKIKCDGTKPFCLHCQESNLECEYTESKKRGPRKGYVQVLEDRLAQLEKMLVVSDKKGIQSTEYDDLPDPEIVTHLIDLFFRYINSVFPFVHRGRLKQSIVDKTVSKPLLWSVMATAARFSDHPSIKTDPPYLASEKFALKANSLINASLLEPTLPNIQFWGIMSCLEYGSASGSKAWIYGGIAVRLCQELGINKEEVLKTPIKAPDGSTDYLGMALRRRIFWSCFCIDKFSSTSTDRPQGFEIGDYDVRMPTITESRLIRDSLQAYTVDRVLIDDDPLMGTIDYYLSILEIFGEISKYMSRVKTDSTAVIWPPIKEHGDLHKKIRQWAINLPEIYRYTPANVSMYRKAASENYLNFWLCSHAIYCAGMLALHRGSLAYGDLSACELSFGTYERMQESIVLCKEHVDIAMDVFSKLRDFCDCNVLPYMGYSAYIFLTALMTSTFSSDSASYSRSNTGLIILYDTIKLLCPYWKMGDRLTAATQDMLKAHSKLYDVRDQEKSKRQNEYTNNQFTQLKKTNSSPEITSSSASTEGTMLFSQTASSTTSEVPFPTTFMSNVELTLAALIFFMIQHCLVK
ncbi:hypothetical protein G6F36_012747 [Rhizopus arrhizus]|nr:hypothetical protein G6F36_012747 [Rhizopus arrhizus]